MRSIDRPLGGIPISPQGRSIGLETVWVYGWGSFET
jgi:hypothetical protein